MWLELPEAIRATPEITELIVKYLDKLGCEEKLVVTDALQPAIGGSLDLAGLPLPAAKATFASLVRGKAPGAHPMFEDTQLVPYNEWHPLQAAKTIVHAKPSAKP